jgi:hypothetical protein
LFEKLGFWRVGEPKFFLPHFGFCPFRARVIGGDFSQGVALCYGLVAPLRRKKISDYFGFCGGFPSCHLSMRYVNALKGQNIIA